MVLRRGYPVSLETNPLSVPSTAASCQAIGGCKDRSIKRPSRAVDLLRRILVTWFRALSQPRTARSLPRLLALSYLRNTTEGPIYSTVLYNPSSERLHNSAESMII